MTWWFLFASLLVATFGYWLIRGRRAAQPSSSREDVSCPYHSVAIKHPESACVAVKSVAGRKFLSREAPLVPLGNCEAATCRCRYVHFDDRRDDDRRSPYSTRQVLLGGSGHVERRMAADRRRIGASVSHRVSRRYSN